MKFKRTK